MSGLIPWAMPDVAPETNKNKNLKQLTQIGLISVKIHRQRIVKPHLVFSPGDKDKWVYICDIILKDKFLERESRTAVSC